MIHNGYYYNTPFLHSAPGYYVYPSNRQTRHDQEAIVRERERLDALAAQRARRAQYLPHEDINSDEENLYRPLSQRERMYLEARRRQESEAFRRQKETHEPSQKHSIPINVPESRPHESSTPPVVEYSQAHHDAADKIQKWFRHYRALRSISDVATQFEQAKKELAFPDSLDFVDPDKPGEVITISIAVAQGEVDGDIAIEAVDHHSVAHQTTELRRSEDAVTETTSSSVSSSEDTPQLAYTKRNYPVHAYMEKLNVLLMKLDDIQSYGLRKVRDRRKEVARMIEKEAERVEREWKDGWNGGHVLI